MLRHCPRCGRALEPEDVSGGLATCPACGTAVSEAAGGPTVIDPEAARQKVRPPAIGLMIAGALVVLNGVAMPALMGVGFAVGGFPAVNPEERVLAFGMLGAMAALGAVALAAGAAISFGGYRMYHLQSWMLAMIVSVLAIVSFAGCCAAGVFGLFGLPALPIGIWAIVVLNDANVKAAFRS
jgi:hypothetical protein